MSTTFTPVLRENLQRGDVIWTPWREWTHESEQGHDIVLRVRLVSLWGDDPVNVELTTGTFSGGGRHYNHAPLGTHTHVVITRN